jgi:hypothetical protein
MKPEDTNPATIIDVVFSIRLTVTAGRYARAIYWAPG